MAKWWQPSGFVILAVHARGSGHSVIVQFSGPVTVAEVIASNFSIEVDGNFESADPGGCIQVSPTEILFANEATWPDETTVGTPWFANNADPDFLVPAPRGPLEPAGDLTGSLTG